MLMTLNYSKIGVGLNAIYIIGTIIFLSIILPPLWDESGSTDDDGLRTYELLEAELDGFRESQRELMGQVSDLGRELKTANVTLDSLRSTIEDEFANNLSSGDDIIESGILIDEGRLISNEIERRLRERD